MILMTLVAGLIFTTPFVIIAGNHTTASVLVLLALSLCFIGGYQMSTLDKYAKTHERLREDIRNSVLHNIGCSINKYGVIDDIDKLKSKVNHGIDYMINSHLDI